MNILEKDNMGSIHLDIGYCSRSWKKLEILNVKELYILYERERIYIYLGLFATLKGLKLLVVCVQYVF